MSALFYFLPLFAATYVARSQDDIPVLIPPVSFQREDSASCPSAGETGQAISDTRQQVEASLDEVVLPLLNFTCPCGSGHGILRKIAYLDMTDPSQQCPPNWNLITSPVRACAGADSTCVSAIFPSNGISYSHVCGKIHGYQFGSPDGFKSADDNPGIDGTYVDGVSVTHGAAGSRQHIWSLAATTYKSGIACPCDQGWPELPSFVGDDYFCDSAILPMRTWKVYVYPDDPLWDGAGEGCEEYGCCLHNSPPWFCKRLPQPTMDDIEVRICNDENVGVQDSIVDKIDIYVA